MKDVDVSMTINGLEYSARIEARTLLVHFIREVAGLTGTHIGCDTTNCGACTVLLNGKAVKSCTLLAVQASGQKISTVEGLEREGKMHPVQKAFLEKHGLQCGYCTPGMLMTAVWMLSEKEHPDEETVKKYFSGNLCRCTGYRGIVDAVLYASYLLDGEEK